MSHRTARRSAVGGGGCRGVAAVLASLLLSSGCTSGEPIGATPGSPSFDGTEAYELVRTQLGFGPRVPGTAGHAAQLAWMLAYVDSLGVPFQADSFQHETTSGDTLDLVNVLARFAPERDRRILLLAHWDTRPTSDQAADPGLRATPVPGANDGASGTAVLLALARLMADNPPPVGVDLLLVDGEDYGPGIDDMLLGARRYASRLTADRPVYGVLLDMVGDADPRFPIEGFSARHADLAVRKTWRAAERLGYADHFPSTVGIDLTDDHVPITEAGLPTANVIDFTYGPGNAYWHTPDDVLANVSARTLGIVGEVVTELVYSGG